jgi:hypothetical protein
MQQRSFKTFEDAFTAEPEPEPAATLVGANDNKPSAKTSARYRGTLPALRWLFDHDAELGRAMAAELPKAESNFSVEVHDSKQEIRPTPGEIVKAASDGMPEDGTPAWLEPVVKTGRYGGKGVHIGSLKFVRGKLVKWGETAKGHELRPVDRITSVSANRPPERSPSRYLKTRPTTPSPLHAQPLPRAVSAAPALPPMYDPQAGVEDGRELLHSLGVDGSVPAERLPVPVTRCPTAVAKGAEFIGGVSHPCGTASKSAPRMWEGPEERKGEVRVVIEEVASRGTLKSIGERLGFYGERADRKGKEALLNAALVLVAANDNEARKKSAA